MSSVNPRAKNETSSSLWKVMVGKNGDKYLTFSGGNKRSSILNHSRSDSQSEDTDILPGTQIKVYKIRWYILFVICLANISNAINWINFSAIADFTGQFYSINYDYVNYLSLVYLIMATPAGFFSFWLIDNFGVRSSINIGTWLNFIGSGVRMLSAIDSADATPLIPMNSKYTVLMIGQCLCALAQPFIVFVSTKFANTWFAEDQRALANTLALGSNTLGILIGALISPQIVNSSISFVSEMCFLLILSTAISLVPALMACFVLRSSPKTPPSYSAIINQQQRSANSDYLINEQSSEQLDASNNSNSDFKIYLGQVGRLLKSKDFLILFFSFGVAMGLFNSLTTLIEQILCIRGYSDTDSGYFGGAMIISGLIGSLISGVILDKTKRFEEVAKFCFSMSALASIFFSIIQLYNNDNSLIYYLMLLSFVFIGVFGLPLLPICMEMSVECVYPIPEATSTGLLFIAGQIVGIAMILAYPKIAKDIPKDTYIYDIIQTCTINPNSANSTTSTPSSSSTLSVLDFTYPIYGQTILLVLIAIGFIIFFKCAYLRLRSEREKMAQRILDEARN